MKKTVITVLLLSALCVSSAFGADVKKHFSIAGAAEYSSVRDVLEGDIAMYWGGQTYPPVVEKYGEFRTSKRTNGFRKGHKEACAHALASALIALRDRANREGGDAIVGIVSNIKNHEESSATEYTCNVGSFAVNVALKGSVVKLGGN